MRISSRGRGEEGRERITLVPENVDDLWHLSHVLEDGDRVSGDTTRRIQRDDENLRDTGGAPPPLVVTIGVADGEFAPVAAPLPGGGRVPARRPSVSSVGRSSRPLSAAVSASSSSSDMWLGRPQADPRRSVSSRSRASARETAR